MFPELVFVFLSQKVGLNTQDVIDEHELRCRCFLVHPAVQSTDGANGPCRLRQNLLVSDDGKFRACSCEVRA